MTPLIEAHNLTKTYSVELFDSLSLSVSAGEVLAIRGDNGSGKSTLLKMLAGLTQPTQGSIQYIKPDMTIGYVPEKFPDDTRFDAAQYLHHMSKIQGLPKHMRRHRISSLLQQFHLDGQQGNAIHTFSKGMKQKVGIMQALLTRPDILLLDEPLSGLDPGTQNDLESILYQLKLDGLTMIVACHNQRLLHSIADRMLMLGDQPDQSNDYSAGETSSHIIIEANTKAQKLEFLHGITGLIDKTQMGDGNVVRLTVEPSASDYMLLALIRHGCHIQSLYREGEK